MAATDLIPAHDNETHLVESWRFESLRRAGYDAESATVLALSHEIDLHGAIDLVERGCPVDLALQILI